jgi:hypothetical protein
VKLLSRFAFNTNLRRYNKGAFALASALKNNANGRGLHSSTFRLNCSAVYGIGAAFRGCLEGVWRVLGGGRGCLGCNLCQKRLRVS